MKNIPKPVAYLSEEFNPGLTEPLLKSNYGLVKPGLTSLVK